MSTTKDPFPPPKPQRSPKGLRGLRTHERARKVIDASYVPNSRDEGTPPPKPPPEWPEEDFR